MTSLVSKALALRTGSAVAEVLAPTRGDVAWIIDGGPRPYWRGTLSTREELRDPLRRPLG